MLARSLAVAVMVHVTAASLAAQEYGRVTGRVTSSESKQTLEGARVTVPGTSLSAITDASGHYLLARVPAGAQTIQVAAIGRTPATRQVTVRANQSETADVELGLAAVEIAELNV